MRRPKAGVCTLQLVFRRVDKRIVCLHTVVLVVSLQLEGLEGVSFIWLEAEGRPLMQIKLPLVCLFCIWITPEDILEHVCCVNSKLHFFAPGEVVEASPEGEVDTIVASPLPFPNPFPNHHREIHSLSRYQSDHLEARGKGPGLHRDGVPFAIIFPEDAAAGGEELGARVFDLDGVGEVGLRRMRDLGVERLDWDMRAYPPVDANPPSSAGLVPTSAADSFHSFTLCKK